MIVDQIENTVLSFHPSHLIGQHSFCTGMVSITVPSWDSALTLHAMEITKSVHYERVSESKNNVFVSSLILYWYHPIILCWSMLFIKEIKKSLIFYQLINLDQFFNNFWINSNILLLIILFLFKQTSVMR